MRRTQTLWILLGAYAASACGSSGGDQSTPEQAALGGTRQALSGALLASNIIYCPPGSNLPDAPYCGTCLVSTSSQLCSSDISWYVDSSAMMTYQVFVREDNGPYKYFACSPASSTSVGHSTAPWIRANHAYRFSLRATTAGCESPDPGAQELDHVTIYGINATLAADSNDGFFSPKPVMVPAGGPGTTNIYWGAAYGLNNVVWVSEFNGSSWGPYTNFACNLATQGSIGSATAPWIQSGHSYRFSLRPTPTTLPCTTTDSSYPEVAAVTVQGVTDFIKPERERCSTTSTGTCSTTLHWVSSSLAGNSALKGSIDVSTAGTTWTQLACVSTSTGTVSTGDLLHDTKYSYRFRPVSVCSDTTAPATATTSVFPLSNVIVPDGTTLKLGGAPFKAMGMNKYDLFRQYIMKPDYQHALGCSDPVTDSDQARAEQDMADLAAKGIQYLRVAGIGYYAYDPFVTPADTQPFELQMWQSCPTQYWQRFDAMLAKAKSLGLKLIVTLVHSQCMFPDLMREHLGDMIKNPASQSRKKLLQYAQALVSRYKNNVTIQGWELMNELDSLADLDNSTSNICPYAESSADNFTSDDMVRFMASLATSVRGWDPKHFITSGYTDFRPAAAHLRARPGFLAGGGPNPNIDWTPDDRSMFESFVRFTHEAPIDVVSMHHYNGDLNGDPNVPSNPERGNTRFGISGFYNADVLGMYKSAADRAGKPLFLGEYNDAWDCPAGDTCFFPADHRWTYARTMLEKILELQIPLSTQWTWELHDGPTWYSIQPGQDSLTDEYIGIFQARKASFDATTQGIDLTPDNAGFELDSNGDGTPDSWIKAGGAGNVTLVDAGYDGKAVRISPTATGSPFVESTAVMPGVLPPSMTLLASVAVLTNATIPDARLCVYGFPSVDGTGAATASRCSLVTGDPDHFKVFSLSFAASGIKSVKVRLLGSNTGYVQFDDVRLTALY